MTAVLGYFELWGFGRRGSSRSQAFLSAVILVDGL